MNVNIRITEIFFSLQGESRSVGCPTVFVRLTGCPLRCAYCDTSYAFTGGIIYKLDQVLREVSSYSPRYVTVTGGEPLSQLSCLPLLTLLCDAGYEVSLETSGALDIAQVDSRVSKVMDIKTPGSEEHNRNLYSNIEHLSLNDQIKFVICDENDYIWSKSKLTEFALTTKVSDVLFSPSHAALAPGVLADWILRDRLPVRMQVQLHKYLWADAVGR
jgi:7-carboxy-7-deazaguanine synthase